MFSIRVFPHLADFRIVTLALAAAVQCAAASADKPAASPDEGVLIEAEDFIQRHPDDGEHAQRLGSPFAFGGQAVTRFFRAPVRCVYHFDVDRPGKKFIYLRYASNRDQSIRFAFNPENPLQPAGQKRRTGELGATDALAGPEAWRFTSPRDATSPPPTRRSLGRSSLSKRWTKA